MTWLSPIAGLILAAAVIPPLVILYFLKLRRRPQNISSTLLWKRAVEDLRANALFQRLRPSLLLFLQLLALLLLALALAQPQIDAGWRKGGRVVLLIDNSASMNATDGPDGRTRLDEAKRLAKARVENLHGGGIFGGSPGQIMVVAFSDRAEVRCPFSDSKKQILDAIDSILPTHGASRIEQPLTLARAYTTNLNPDRQDVPIAEPANLELFSDGRIQDLDTQVLRGESIRYQSIGATDTANLAVTAVAADRPVDRPGQIQVFASVANFSTDARTAEVQMSVDGAVKAITPEPLRIPAASINESTGVMTPGRARVVFLPFEQPSNAAIEVAILAEDALAADNYSSLVVPPAKALRVALVTKGDFIVRSILEGVALQSLRQVSPDEFDALAAEPGGIDGYDVVILENVAPKSLPPGRYLTLGPTPPIEDLVEYGEPERSLILSTRDDHPVMRFVNLEGQIIIGSLHKLQPNTNVTIIAEAAAGPAIVEFRRGGVSVIHVAFDPLDSTWPFERSWVNFVVNAVEYLGGATAAIASESLHPGEAISTRLPASATDVELLLPDGKTESVRPPDPTQFTWGPTRLSGTYELKWSQPGSATPEIRKFAVNMDAEAEGRIDAAPTILFSKDEVKGDRSGSAVQTPLWPWLIGVVLALLMVEWWVYTRRTAV